MGELFRHGSDVGNIVSHHHVGQSEIRSGTERKVTHYEAVCREKAGFISKLSLIYQVENYF